MCEILLGLLRSIRFVANLFDFDLEAEPILQVLVGKALELARVELAEESEKEKLK